MGLSCIIKAFAIVRPFLYQFVIQLVGFTGCILRAFALQSANDAILQAGYIVSVMIRYQRNTPVLLSHIFAESQLAPHPRL